MLSLPPTKKLEQERQFVKFLLSRFKKKRIRLLGSVTSKTTAARSSECSGCLDHIKIIIVGAHTYCTYQRKHNKHIQQTHTSTLLRLRENNQRSERTYQAYVVTTIVCSGSLAGFIPPNLKQTMKNQGRTTTRLNLAELGTKKNLCLSILGKENEENVTGSRAAEHLQEPVLKFHDYSLVVSSLKVPTHRSGFCSLTFRKIRMLRSKNVSHKAVLSSTTCGTFAR
jgi:hypothetical protein